jgi:hypothetical protein
MPGLFCLHTRSLLTHTRSLWTHTRSLLTHTRSLCTHTRSLLTHTRSLLSISRFHLLLDRSISSSLLTLVRSSQGSRASQSASKSWPRMISVRVLYIYIYIYVYIYIYIYKYIAFIARRGQMPQDQHTHARMGIRGCRDSCTYFG